MAKGFTLIELIVVIAIIAVLAAIVSPSAFRAIEKAKITRFVLDYKAAKTAVYSFYSDTGRWFCEDEDLANPLVSGNGPVCGGGFANYRSVPGWDGPYLDKLATPPWNPLSWVAGSWLRWRSCSPASGGCSDNIASFCYENGLTPPLPVAAMEKIDEMVDGTIDRTTGFVRSLGSGGYPPYASTFCFWLVARQE